MSAPTPDALAAAERDLAAARADHDKATIAMWAAQVVDIGNPALDVNGFTARERLTMRRARVRRCASACDRAFDALAALRSAASPLRLVPRALTPDEAAALAAAGLYLAEARRWHDVSLRALWTTQGRLLARLAGGTEATIGRTRLVLAVELSDCALSEQALSAALDARAPLLAAQWEAAS